MTMEVQDYKYYQERMKDVKLEDITSDEYNAIILESLRYDDPRSSMLKFITITTSHHEENGFVVQEGEDLGWLGYFVGRSKNLEALYIDNFRGNINRNAFLRGLEHNRSIQNLQIGIDLRESFQSLIPFLRNNDSLRELGFNSIDIGLQCARNIAFLLGQSSSLKRLEIYDTDLEDDGLVEILTAVKAHTQIEELSMPSNYNLGREGYAALGRMLEGSRLSLLNVGHSGIDDEGLCALVEGLRNCHKLTSLNLNRSMSITEVGLRSLSTLFQSDISRLREILLDEMNIGDDEVRILAPGLANLPSLQRLTLFSNSIGDQGIQALVGALASCNLTELSLSYNRSITANGLTYLLPLLLAEQCTLCILDLYGIHIGDDGAAVLANGLRGNKSLTTLRINTPGITTNSWEAFSRLLCDTSSVNNTYLSNHTLVQVGGYDMRDTPQDVEEYLDLNKFYSKFHDQAPAICKIIDSHPDIDFTPLLQWKMKCLPLVVEWHEKAKSYLCKFNVLKELLQCRQLSAVYKFVRGMPQLAVDIYGRQKMNDIQSDAKTKAKKKRKFDRTM